MQTYNNVTSAFQKCLDEIFKNGQYVTVRGNETKELSPCSFIIEDPLSRVYIIPNRRNNIFSTIAETLWVIGGRNDIKYLSYYLPRSEEFSDDGLVWRAGYGPRLRNWKGVDQFKEIVNLINSDPNTRRAVMSIFDPASDFINSRDIPCNNWLHFLVRNNKLDMSIAVRSCDIMWGFTGINTFEWSVIQELISFWTGYEVGKMSFFIGSFHLYERHFKRAEAIINSSKRKVLYDFGYLSPKFQTNFNDFDIQMSKCFELEEAIRSGNDVLDGILGINDDFLRNSMLMLMLHHLWKIKEKEEKISEIINLLDESDYKIAAIEFFVRRKFSINFDIAKPGRNFFDYYFSKNDIFEINLMVSAIKKLHYKKTLIYKNSWRKHGEILGILSNISRKYDRIETLFESSIKPTSDETLVDTIVDLTVYALKYLTYIAEFYPEDFISYFNTHLNKLDLGKCVHNEGFEYMLDSILIIYNDNNINQFDSQTECFLKIQTAYRSLESILINTPTINNQEKCEYCNIIACSSIRYLELEFLASPVSFATFKAFVDNL